MRDEWFWGTPDWARYCRAYGGPTTSNFGPNGNLVVELAPQSTMWSRIRKGHQAAIRVATKSAVSVRTRDSGWAEADDLLFWTYREIHRQQHGHSRSDDSFEVMREIAATGRGMVFLVALGDGPWEAAAYFYRYRAGTYYASAARNLLSAAPLHHLILWEAMCLFQKMGYEWLDLGPVPDDSASDKARAVAHFKRGFGPEVRIWPDYPA